MMLAFLKPNRGFQRVIELFMVVFIIAAVVLAAMHYYKPCLTIARIAQAAASCLSGEEKLDIHLFHALNGYWPGNEDDSLSVGIHEHLESYPTEDAVRKTVILDGAIHMDMNPEYIAGRITLQPGTPIGDPAGPVIWACSPGPDRSAWFFAGENKTTLPDRFIPKSLR